MRRLQATVKRGKAVGAVLRLQRHADGNFVVSMTRFEKDYFRVPREADHRADRNWGAVAAVYAECCHLSAGRLRA
jgi:hypothetical protein